MNCSPRLRISIGYWSLGFSAFPVACAAEPGAGENTPTLSTAALREDSSAYLENGTLDSTGATVTTGTGGGASATQCLAGWRSNSPCGAYCLGQTQADRKNCQAYLDCYKNNNCGPSTCGQPDQVCGVNKVVPKMGSAPKEIADSVYECMACPGTTPSSSCNGKINTTPCTDGNGCTTNDKCQNNLCISGSPVTCTAIDQCHLAGACNPSNGLCSNPLKANGTACTDGNACTTADICQSGTCMSGSPVQCAAPDQCHALGICNTSTGICSNPELANGTLCNDDNACTQTDTCQSGNCTGADPITCTALDQCHIAGTCDTTTGTCSNPTQADGTECTDNSVCTAGDSCQSGNCAPGPSVAVDDNNPCTADFCDASGGVQHQPLAAGTSCADSDLCNGTETCNGAGACVVGTPVTCAAPDQCHLAGALCSPFTGTCINAEKPDGTICEAGGQWAAECKAGTCTPMPGKCLIHSEFSRWATQQGGWMDAAQWLAGNFSGSGRTDLALVFNDGGGASIDLHLNNGSSFSTYERRGTKQGGWPDTGQWLAGNFNGDWLTDLALVFKENGHASIDLHPNQNGNFPTYNRVATGQGGWPDSGQWLAGDFDGDGLTDIALVFDDNGYASIDVHRNQGGSFPTYERWGTQQGGWPDSGQWSAGDFDGDGLTDIALVFDDNGYASIDVHLNQGGSFPTYERWGTQQGGWPDSARWVSGDFTGDAASDLALVFNDGNSNAIDVHPSTKTMPGFATYSRWAAFHGGWMDSGNWVSGDFNGDGSSDLAVVFNDGGYATVDVHKMGKFSRDCAPTAMSGLETYVDESTMGGNVDTEELQGITQGGGYWYLTSRLRVYKVGTVEDLSDVQSSLMWQIADLPTGTAVFCQMGYNHIGAPNFYDGKLYVVLTGTDPETNNGEGCPLPNGVMPPAAVLALNTNLVPVGFAVLPGGGGGWVAVNPIDGRLYNASPFGTLRVYDLNKLGPIPVVADVSAQAKLDYIGRVDLPLGFSGDYWDQGGAFSPNGTFYYVADTGFGNSEEDPTIQSGVHAFKLVPFAENWPAIAPPPAVEPLAHVINGPPNGTQPGIQKAFVTGDTNTGYFRIGYDWWYGSPINSRKYELEGTTVYRGTDGLIHLLVLMLHNELGEDDVSLYGWRTDEH